MKHNKLKILILAVAPFLLMANSPAPAARPFSYEDASCTVVSSTAKTTKEYETVVDLTNTGEGYLIPQFGKKDTSSYFNSRGIQNSIFANDSTYSDNYFLVGPGETLRFTGTTTDKWGNFDPTDYAFEAYTLFDNKCTSAYGGILFKKKS